MRCPSEQSWVGAGDVYSLGKARLGTDRPASGQIKYRGTSLIRKRTPLGPYRRPMPRVLGGSWGGGRFLMGEVPLYSVEAKCGAQTEFTHSLSFVFFFFFTLVTGPSRSLSLKLSDTRVYEP